MLQTSDHSCAAEPQRPKGQQDSERLCDALSATLTIDESLSLLSEGRPQLLAWLKELGGDGR